MPIPAFNRTDADVSLIFLINRAEFLEPVDDLWFHSPNSVPLLDGLPAYVTDQLVSVMGCIEQYQFCKPQSTGSAGCTTLINLATAEDPTIALELELNDAQRTLILHFATLLKHTTLKDAVSTATLLAQEVVDSDTHISSPLPSNQVRIF